MSLGRDVAINILPRDVTPDPERLARIEREDDDVRGLVLEFVNGHTLAQHLTNAFVFQQSH